MSVATPTLLTRAPVTPTDDAQLARTAIRGVAWEGSSYLAGKALVFATTVVLARVLSPADFGLVAMVLVFVSAAEVLTTVGFSQALIYLPAKPRRNDAGLAASVAIGAIAAAMGVAGAGMVGRILGNPSATNLVRVGSVALLLAAAWQVPDALLRRNLRFRRRVSADIARACARGIASIALALAGAGPWAIIGGLLIGDAVYAIAAWKLVDYRPARSFWRVTQDDLRPLLRYGGPSAAAAVGSYLLFNIDYVIVGRALGAEQLGFYLLAFRIPEMAIINAFFVFSAVAFPAFSRLHDDRPRLARGYLRAVRLQSVYGVAAGCALALAAPIVITVVFGPRWNAAIAPLVFLAIYAACRSIGTSAADVYRATGHPGLAAAIAAVRLVVLVPVLALATRWGIQGVAVAQAVAALAFACAMQAVAVRLLKLHAGDLLRALGPSVALAACVAAVVGVRAL